MNPGEDDANLKAKRLVEKIYSGEADFDESYAMIKEMLIHFAQDDRASTTTLTNYGAALSDTGSHAAAIPDLQRAVDTSPDFSQAYFNLGVAFMNTRKLKDGVELIRKSHQFPKNDLAIEAYFDPMAH